METEQISWDNRFRHWLMQGVKSPDKKPNENAENPQEAWWKVMCLTGVDYFSTLGYQPGIAFLAANVLSPIATLVLVLLTIFGALPIYRRVAAESPHGEGSIAMLERLLPRWKGKLFVLVLLGFVATDFVITITLSAADATAHIIENPFVLEHIPFLNHPVYITLGLISLLGGVFLRGFKEAIGIAVVLVSAYLFLNVIVLGVGFYEIFTHPTLLLDWKNALFVTSQNGITEPRTLLAIILMSLIVFPKLALGLSGFETGVAVMPLVKSPNRIANTNKLLMTAALIMSVMLIASSFVTSVLIPAAEFAQGGKANGRALAFIAHNYLGEYFGTAYDVSTILILWFAGASAMAGLLNIVPRYLPRYGMAPEWARATRPLVFVFLIICFVITFVFQADVDAQGGAYATGVLVLMTSAAIAVTISAWKKQQPIRWAFLVISAVFAYTTLANVFERPDGLKIGSIFIFTIILTSFISRALRSTEIRIDKIELDETARELIKEIARGEIRVVANRRDNGSVEEYKFKTHKNRINNNISENTPILFYEVELADASEFKSSLTVRGSRIGKYRVLRVQSASIPNAIAAFLMYLRDETEKIPHMYFGWSEGNPFKYLLKFIFFGEGDTAPVTHEILRKAEPDPAKRPNVHVGG